MDHNNSSEAQAKFKKAGAEIKNEVQDFYELRKECLEKKILFEDPEFPCDDSTLYFSPKLAGDIEWKRPKEIVDEGMQPRFFLDGPSRFDIEQGRLGDCWLLAAMATLTLDEKLLYKVVPDDQSFDKDYAGIFYFRFWQCGKWIEICIDDRLPTVDGKLNYDKSPFKSEFWDALLEKACAKIYGSYKVLKGGLINIALQDFTGGITETYDLDSAPSNLFDIMLESYERNSLMGCDVLHDDSSLDFVGLLGDHSYSVTKICYIDSAKTISNVSYQLIRVRNPWGDETEWNGDWSDTSDSWKSIPDAEKKEMGLTTAYDGEFWISFKDLKIYFDKVEICHIPNFSKGDSRNRNWVMKDYFIGEWIRDKTAGGTESLALNPQYRFTLTEKDGHEGDGKSCTVLVALLQNSKSPHSNETPKIGFSIFKLNDNEAKSCKCLDAKFFANNDDLAGRIPHNSREVNRRLSLPVGDYCIVPFMDVQNQEGKFLIRILLDKKMNEK